jgi:hypothetical protein
MNAVRTAVWPMAQRRPAPATVSDLLAEHDEPSRKGERVDRAFNRSLDAMRAAYRATGGTVRADDLACWLQNHQCGDVVSLGKLIEMGEVFSFEWHDTFWVPLFQFDLRDMSIKPGPRKVIAELVPVFANWTIALWLTQPTYWLRGRKPIDVLGSDLAAVIEAARCDRIWRRMDND